MNRESAVQRLQHEQFDVLVVGGGATGLGCAVDAASRGYTTALIEGHDFAKATSSRSTKLIHGGVRYLQQGDIPLVREALHERAHLLRNAPELVHALPFLVPADAWWQLPYYATGLRIYDILAGGGDVPHSRMLSARRAREYFPSLRNRDVRGALVYWDAQFDDARLAIALAQTAVDCGAAVANYVRAESLLYHGPRVAGVRAIDCEFDQRFDVRARVVVNATGIFADELRLQDNQNASPLLRFSRGSHIVVSAAALPVAQAALLVPRTTDGRVLFAIPWHGNVLVGTTDIATESAQLEPAPSSEEVEYILATVNRYIDRPLERRDVRTAFAGLRPLVNRAAVGTARLSREHVVEIAHSGLITIAGGKWTTYRKMAQDTIDAARDRGWLSPAVCRTEDLRLHDVPFVPDVEHAVRHEMARTLEDLLARRKRTLFIDANAALAEAPAAADVLARERGQNTAWQNEQLRRFRELAQRYMGT